MLSAFSHAPCVTVRLSWRVTWKRRKSEKEKPLVSLFRRRRRAAVVGTRAARRRSSSCVLETPWLFFGQAQRVFKQSAKSVNAPPKPKPKTDSNRIKPLFWQTRDSLGSAEALARARPRLHGSGSDGRARLRLSLPVRARFVRRRGSRTGALVPASPEFAKSDGWRISQRESWHPARLRDTLARDVLLSVHPRQARPSGDDLDRRAPGQKAEETADHGDGCRHRRSCVPHIFFSSPRSGRPRARGDASPPALRQGTLL